MRDYPEDVTQEEAEVINAVLEYDALGELYDPNLSDPVKSSYRGDNAALGPYFRVWLRQFFRHPGVYLQATLNNASGFYYPDAQNTRFFGDSKSLDILQFHEPEVLDRWKWLLHDYVAFFESVPFLMPLSSAGVHCWILIFLLLWGVHQKDKRAIYLMLPSFVGLAVCIASPTYTINGVRYALPVIYANPFLAGLCLFRQDTPVHQRKEDVS